MRTHASVCIFALRSAADLVQSEADAEVEKERALRMANLLGFSVVRAPDQATRLLDFSPLFLRLGPGHGGVGAGPCIQDVRSGVGYAQWLLCDACAQDAKRDMRSALSRSALVSELRAKKVRA